MTSKVERRINTRSLPSFLDVFYQLHPNSFSPICAFWAFMLSRHNAYLITDGLIFHHLFSLFFAGKKGKGNNLKLLTSILGLMVTQEKIKQCLKLTRYCKRTVRINLPDTFKTIKYNKYRRRCCVSKNKKVEFQH